MESETTYNYFHPEDVISPKRCVYDVKELFDGGINEVFSLAIVNWQGAEKIGIRWNVNQNEWEYQEKMTGSKKCVGEPNSRGYPTWFILPDDFLIKLLNGEGDLAKKIKVALENINQNKTNL